MSYRYENISQKRIDNKSNLGETIYVNNIYPDIPLVEGDIYIITTSGDRLDLMANDYYGDVSYWWIIASANNLPGDSIYPPIGAQIRIPTNIQEILRQYKSVNTSR